MSPSSRLPPRAAHSEELSLIRYGTENVVRAEGEDRLRKITRKSSKDKTFDDVKKRRQRRVRLGNVASV